MLRLLAILGAMLLVLSAFSILTCTVQAAGTGLYKNTPPSWTERLKAMKRDNSTDEFVSAYEDPRMPSFSEQRRMTQMEPQILVQIIVVVAAVILGGFAIYLHRTDKDPEQVLKESEKHATK